MTDLPAAAALAAAFPSGKVFEHEFEWPLPDDDVRAAMLEAYANGAWGKYHSHYCEALESLLRQSLGVDHVVLCSSGTAAVELALRGGKIGEGDEVILAGYDFAGNFRAIEAVGARPVLIDLAEGSWCLDAAQIEDALSPQTKAIIVSHLHGTLAVMPAIMEIANRRGLYVVEDACQAHGAIVAGKSAGSWGHAGVLSFGGSKLITSGRGGAVLTNQADVKQRITIFADRGNSAYPLSELQAALIVPQWGKLKERHELRAKNAAMIKSSCESCLKIHWPGLQSLEDSPAYYKLAWWFLGTEEETQQYVGEGQQRNVPIDHGFRGFVRRSKRCRTIGTLPRSTRAVSRTVVMHHPILLQSEAIIRRLADALKLISG